MTKEQALEILKLYRNWNVGQTSVDYALNHTRTSEDDIYDQRRALIKEAQLKLI